MFQKSPAALFLLLVVALIPIKTGAQEAPVFHPSRFQERFDLINRLIAADKVAEAERIIDSILPTIEKEATACTKLLQAFPQVPNFDDMNAFAYLLLFKGTCLEKEKKAGEAKSTFERVWRKFPFAIQWTSLTEVSRPARDAYMRWQTLVWLDAFRNQEIDDDPFDAGATFYHARSGYDALESAVKTVAAQDGYRPIEFAFTRMSSSTYFKSLYGSKSVSAMFHALSHAGDDAPDADWKILQSRLDKWCTDSPDSTVARVSLATFWINYAWHARGTGVVSTVSGDGWEKFNERITQAIKLLLKTPQDHPEWFRAMLTAMLSGIGDRSLVDQIFQRGSSQFPTYYSIYGAMRHYLMPRWHGKLGEWEQFAKRVAQSHGPELYLYLCNDAQGYDGEEGIEQNPAVDWNLLKNGYEKAIAARPDSWALASQYAYAACRREDKKTAKRAFEARATVYHPIVWGPLPSFGRWYLWATSEN